VLVPKRIGLASCSAYRRSFASSQMSFSQLLSSACIPTFTAAERMESVASNPTFLIAALISAAFMKVRQANCDLMFAAMSMEIPTLMPMTSGFVQAVFGLNASTNPYRFQHRLL